MFDCVVTNIGSAYSASTGQFTAPSDGVYAFAWTILTHRGKWFNSALVLDGTEKLYNAANSGRVGKSPASSGCTGVLRLKAGQKVWIRKSVDVANHLERKWSSFSGWQIE